MNNKIENYIRALSPEFLPFFDEFPDLIQSEFRNIFILENNKYKYIPPGNYAFLEMFCSDLDCDCRKVIINVISADAGSPRIWAQINYGWGSEQFYKKWWLQVSKDLSWYRPMSGVTFDPPTKDPLKNEFLTIFEEIIKNDRNYALRIEKHYNMFKAKMRDKKIMRQHRKLAPAGRNAPCPCNSGKKFKKCCLIKD